MLALSLQTLVFDSSVACPHFLVSGHGVHPGSEAFSDVRCEGRRALWPVIRALGGELHCVSQFFSPSGGTGWLTWAGPGYSLPQVSQAPTGSG